MTQSESDEGWLMPCGACGATTFIPGQGEPKFCPRCGNRYGRSDRCGATHPAIDGGRPCQRMKGHLTSDTVHITANGFCWAETES